MIEHLREEERDGPGGNVEKRPVHTGENFASEEENYRYKLEDCRERLDGCMIDLQEAQASREKIMVRESSACQLF